MQTLETLRQRIHTVRELESVVHTMKALSSATIRQYENAVTALADYYRTVELALHAVLRGHRIPPLPRRPVRAATAAIVLGSDQGLCGRFNELIVEHTLPELADFPGPPPRLPAVGARVAAQLQEQNRPVETTLPVPGSVAAITRTVEHILLQIDTWQVHHEVHDVLLLHNRPAARALYHPQRIQLLPLDFSRFRQLEQRSWPSHNLPVFSMERRTLLSALLRQYFFVLLFRACAESLACEHAARLAAMQRAGKNIEEHLQTLNAQYRQQRQASITEELLDIVAGYETLTGDPQ